MELLRGKAQVLDNGPLLGSRPLTGSCKSLRRSRRNGVVVLPMAFGPETDSQPRFDFPLVQGASRNVVQLSDNSYP